MINLTVNPPLAPSPPQINSVPLISSLFQWKKVNTSPPPLSIVVGMNWQMHITVANSYETFLWEHVLGLPFKFVSPALNVYTLHPVPPNATENPGGGTPHMKGVGMLVVSLRGVNFRF